MKLYRTQEIKTNKFEVGDVIAFTLTDGEKVEAMAVNQEEDGMIFCAVDCLKKQYRMNKKNTNHGGYEASDLRKVINGKIFELFPNEIREKMVAFDNGDLLRIPTEREIFGKNSHRDNEPESITQWEPMEDRRNRIAFRGSKTGTWEWYWLQNKEKDSATHFAFVTSIGLANHSNASSSLGVRPVFKIKMDSEAVRS